MRSLVALYINRGYPADEVHKWLYKNLSERWNNRLAPRPGPTDGADVLVLKTQYNLAWNYFSATQLGDTIFGYWREWLKRSDARDFDEEYPDPETANLTASTWSLFGGFNEEFARMWDLRQTQIFQSRVIVSRKRTRNFLDLTNLWKRSVLENLEEQTLSDFNMQVHTASTTFTTGLKRPLIPDPNTTVVGRSLKRRRGNHVSNGVFAPPDDHFESPDNSDDEMVPVWGGRSSPGPSNQSWASAPMGSWGRGSRM